ncbi:MAG: insulinase family protein [Deltaproteobacteria bacterium]|nr:insulinase family protein [Deltaproteobacteria bacterium]
MAHIRSALLKSGIKVITEEMPDCESASIGVWVKSGSRDERPKECGISHFIEHLLFKGTKKRTALDIAREIEGVGGVLNAFTSREYTCFYAKVLNKDAALAIDILSDIFLNSTFDPVELEKERMVVLQEIKMVDDTPDDLVHDLFALNIWKGNPLGSPVQGSEKTVGSMTRDDVLGYFRRRYHHGRVGRVFITVAGGIKDKFVVKLIDKAFGGLKNGNAPPVSPAPEPSVGVRLIKRDLEQIHLCLGVPTVSQPHADRYKLYLLNTILGGGMSSRLFQEIREKRGLAYSVYSYLNLMRDAGALTVYAGTSKGDFKNVVNLIIKEWGKLRKGVGREELSSAKEQVKGGMLLGLEASDSRMTKLARDEIYFGRVVTVGEIVKAIDAVRLSDLKEIAHKTLDKARITLVAIGKVAKGDLPAGLRAG